MLKRPQWVKEKIDGREKEIPLQMTVKKKYVLQAPYANMPTMGTITGSGFDSKVQPGKMVDVQVHEGEGIIPNNAMQGLTGEEFKGLVKTLSSGSIDKNKLREAINMPTVQEFQSGGVVPGYRRDSGSSRSRGVPDERAKDVEPEPPPTKQEYLNMRFPDYGTDNKSIQTSAVTREMPTAPTTRIAVPQPQTIATSEVPLAKTVTTKPPEPITVQTSTPQQTIQTQEVKRDAVETPIVKAPVTEMPKPPEETTTTPAETVTQPVVSPAGEMVRQGLQMILEEAQGVSDVDRKIANFYLQNTDASNAANLRVLESQISADPFMSDQAKRAAIAGLNREARALRSNQVGEFAIDAAHRASAAARDLVTYGGQVRSYEEVTLPQARQNLEIQRRTFDEITKPMSELQIKQLESELGTQNWNEIQQMINQGIGINRVNDKLAEKGISPLSTDEYINILQAGSLGERNWNRQLAAANTLLATPGENNKVAAAEMLSNLYEGVSFDFSQLITQENAETFSQGLSQMASYVAAGLDIDSAMAAMKKDGTFTMMGIDEGQLAQLYNATKVNALDAEWEEVESSQMYQDLLNSNDPAKRELAANIRQFNILATMGMLDYETLHEYKITGPDGVPKGSIYAKTPQEAQAQADGYGVGYTIQDTGDIDFAIKKEPATELEGEAAGISGKWEEFQKSIPTGVDINQDLYKRWESWQKNNSGDYGDFIKTETPANKLQAINVGTKKELLDKKNSDILFDAFEQNPEEVKNSGYYLQYPDKQYLKDNIKTTRKAGKNVTTMSSALESTFNDAEGKIVELPNGTVGQVVSAKDTPSTVQLKVKQKDGTFENYIVYKRGEGVNYASS
jgi:hypothetical protein